MAMDAMMLPRIPMTIMTGPRIPATIVQLMQTQTRATMISILWVMYATRMMITTASMMMTTTARKVLCNGPLQPQMITIQTAATTVPKTMMMTTTASKMEMMTVKQVN